MAARFVVRSSGEQFHWNLFAGNSEKILHSERYTQKASALTGIASAKANATHDENYDRRTSVAGEPYFVLKARNGEIVGTSEMYSSQQAMEKGIASVKQNAPAAPVVDQS